MKDLTKVALAGGALYVLWVFLGRRKAPPTANVQQGPIYGGVIGQNYEQPPTFVEYNPWAFSYTAGSSELDGASPPAGPLPVGPSGQVGDIPLAPPPSQSSPLPLAGVPYNGPAVNQARTAPAVPLSTLTVKRRPLY